MTINKKIIGIIIVLGLIGIAKFLLSLFIGFSEKESHSKYYLNKQVQYYYNEKNKLHSLVEMLESKKIDTSLVINATSPEKGFRFFIRDRKGNDLSYSYPDIKDDVFRIWGRRELHFEYSKESIEFGLLFYSKLVKNELLCYYGNDLEYCEYPQNPPKGKWICKIDEFWYVIHY